MTLKNPTFNRVLCSSEFVRPDGVILLSDGSEEVWMFFGASENPAALEQVLGILSSPDLKLKVCWIVSIVIRGLPFSRTLLTLFVHMDLSFICERCQWPLRNSDREWIFLGEAGGGQNVCRAIVQFVCGAYLSSHGLIQRMTRIVEGDSLSVMAH